MTDNVMMVSADRSVVAGERGPFHYMLEAFSRHWERVDVIGTRPARVEQTQVFENVHLHHPRTGKLQQANFIADTGRRLAGERPYTVITSHDYNPFYNGWGSWRISKATGIPYVSEIHHVPGYPRAATGREHVDVYATQFYVQWAKKRAAGFRVVNAGELPALLRRWRVPEDRIHVLHSLYMDLDVFAPAEAEPFACDVLLVGRMVPSKGFLQVLQAVHRLKLRGLDAVKVRLLGRGPEVPRLLDFARERGFADRVEHIEWVPDATELAATYRTARLLVCSSFSEGGPRVVAEALACGTPVLSTRVGLTPELVHHGTNGLLYDGTVAQLTLTLQRFLTDSAQEQTLRGNLPADLSSFEREAVIARLAEGLKAIAAGARR